MARKIQIFRFITYQNQQKRGVVKMEKYAEAELEITVFESEDVITDSENGGFE